MSTELMKKIFAKCIVNQVKMDRQLMRMLPMQLFSFTVNAYVAHVNNYY